MRFLGTCIVLAAGAALAGCAVHRPPEPRPEPAATHQPAPGRLFAAEACRGKASVLVAGLRTARPDPRPEAQERQLREIAAQRLAGGHLEDFLRCRILARPPARETRARD